MNSAPNPSPTIPTRIGFPSLIDYRPFIVRSRAEGRRTRTPRRSGQPTQRVAAVVVSATPAAAARGLFLRPRQPPREMYHGSAKTVNESQCNMEAVDVAAPLHQRYYRS